MQDCVLPAASRLSALLKKPIKQEDYAPPSISLIHELPDELLSDIFVVFVSLWPPEDRARVAISTVASVSQLWRMVAWSTPALWTCIDVSPHRGSHPWDMLLDAQIQASGQLPLQVHVRRCPIDWEILERLRPFASRWQEAHLVGSCKTFAQIPDVYSAITPAGTRMPFAQIPLTFPSLTHATIHLQSKFEHYPLVFLNRAPALQSLSLEAMFDLPQIPGWNDASLFFPTIPYLANLTDLRIDGPSSCAEALTTVLQQVAEPLQRLCLFAGKFRDVKMDMPRIPMPNLRAVDLNIHAHHILHYINAPAVESVALRNIPEGGGYPLQCLVEFLQAASPPLHTLEIDTVACGAEFDDPMLPEYHRLLDGVRKLTVRECGSLLDYELLSGMLGTSEVAPLFPQLEELAVHIPRSPVYEETRRVALALAASRTTATVCGGLPVKALRHCDIVEGDIPLDGTA
ncbi:hypothetical protein BD626DRAFT_634670 [Schizophyllum amplum]|uniref:Uncharacterized protein n=1 Tax=Schizophyllum amplum TaxID=97359 RepID=A0A550BYQ0_9AGAR|nr:hypothetical protein BD626DRAFT_634670 [Auriculariopsis ampla]